MFNLSRDQVRQFFCESWCKHRERQILDGAAAVAADLIAFHPEYHALLEDREAIEREFTPEGGQSNPFLHLSLHLAIAEQIGIDSPRGIKEAYSALCRKLAVHNAEHVIMECLAESLWRAQQDHVPIDSEAYLNDIRRCIDA